MNYLGSNIYLDREKNPKMEDNILHWHLKTYRLVCEKIVKENPSISGGELTRLFQEYFPKILSKESDVKSEVSKKNT